MQVLKIINGEGFNSTVTLDLLPSGLEVVRYRSDLDSDADGANGQNGLPIAYRQDGKGTDTLADIGYPRHPDEYSQGLVCDLTDGTPILYQRKGINYFASRTALRMPGEDPNSPESGVDSEFFEYGVVPPCVILGTKGIVLGCRGTALNHRNGKFADFVVADAGPSNKTGEGSIQLCRTLGVPESPRTGGLDTPDIDWTIFPGQPALIRGTQFILQRCK